MTGRAKSLTEFAFARDRLTVAVTMLLILGGVWSWLTYPSQEEPTIPINQALVQVFHPAYDAERMETLVVRPIERRLRELEESKEIVTVIRPGAAQIRLEIEDGTPNYDLAWLRLRAKVTDAAADLPDGTIGPFVNDDFGRVAVATIAMTAETYPLEIVREQALGLRDELAAIPGVDKVSVHGLVGERIEVRTRPAVLAQIGIAPATLADAIAAQNVALGAGRVSVDGVDLRLEPIGRYRRVEDIETLSIALPDIGTVRLDDVATVERRPIDPLETAAFLDGMPAVVFAVSMAEGREVTAFNQGLRRSLPSLENDLPVGFRLVLVTDQGEVVQHVIDRMSGNLYQTIAAVLLVTVLALGWRAGLIVGASVPLTILASIVILRASGIELNQVSIAAFIISLGILVNNPNVVVDDTQARVAAGEAPRTAALTAGRTLHVPLLISTLTTVLAFAPPLLSDNLSAIYMRTLTIVIAVTLFTSWVMAIMVAPLTSAWLIKKSARPDGKSRYERGVYAIAGRVFDVFIGWPRTTVLCVGLLFVGAMALTALLPAGFLPNSDRPQFQIPLETVPGTSATETAAAARSVSAWLTDDQNWPEVESALAYVGDGGPRFILALNPPDPAPHRAYLVVNVRRGTDIAALVGRLRIELARAFPALRTEPKRFSLGETEAGQAVVRVSGRRLDELRAYSEQVQRAFRSIAGTFEIRDDLESPVFEISLRLNETAVRRAAVSRADIVDALAAATDGVPLSTLRDGEHVVPIVWRATVDRRTPERMQDIIVSDPDGRPIPLSALVHIDWTSTPAVIHRRDLVRMVTVVARHPDLTAQQLVDAIRPELDALDLPPGAFWDVGGEIEENEEATAAVSAFLPLSLLLITLIFVWRFNSLRKTIIIMSTAPFCVAGAAMALVLARAPFDFMSTLGLFALVGLIVSNAILVLEQIEEETEAGLTGTAALRMACLKRLRPIVVTQATTILGLMPLLLSGDPLWISFNLVVIGGLLAGTVASLALVPSLYRLMLLARMSV